MKGTLMYFTIGKTKNYKRYFDEQHQPKKAVSGTIWRTYKEAEAAARQAAEYYREDYSVYGVCCEETDVDWHYSDEYGELLKDSDLVKI